MRYNTAETIPASKGAKMFGLKKIRHAFEDSLYNVCGVATAEKRERDLDDTAAHVTFVDVLAVHPDLLPEKIPEPTERQAKFMSPKVALAQLRASEEREDLWDFAEFRSKKLGLSPIKDRLRLG